VPDLVWSAQPLASAADRKRLVDGIPAVLVTLRQGLHLIQWPEDRQKRLFDELMQSHAVVLRGSDAPGAPEATPAAPTFSVSTVRIRLDGFAMETLPRTARDQPLDIVDEAVRHVLRARGSGVSHQWAREGDVPAFGTLGAEEAEAQIARWAGKTWFHVRIGGAMTRARLECLTARGAIALFSSRRADALYSISRASLVTYLRAAWIVPAEPVPLLARAFRTVLMDLRRSSVAKAAADDGPA